MRRISMNDTLNTNKKLRAHSENELKKQKKIVHNQINDKCPSDKQPKSDRPTDRTTRSTVHREFLYKKNLSYCEWFNSTLTARCERWFLFF